MGRRSATLSPKCLADITPRGATNKHCSAKEMKYIPAVFCLLALSGCISLLTGRYQFSDFATINAYVKENTKLYLEAWTGGSARWIADAKVTEKNNEIIFYLTYTMSDPDSDFFWNKKGNAIALIFESENLSQKKVYYKDDTGLHQIELQEWDVGLIEPYVVPELTDPFEPSKAEPDAVGNG